MGTILVGGILAAAVIFVIGLMIRDKKRGKSLQCGCDCSTCGGHCAYKNTDLQEDTQKDDR